MSKAQRLAAARSSSGPAEDAWVPTQLANDGPRYLAIVAALERDIADGRLSEGFRLPPHRDLAEQLGLSVGTVSKAYRKAEQKGILRGRVGQGTFVSQNKPIAVPRPVGGPINLALNVPPVGAQIEGVSKVMAEVCRAQDLGILVDYYPHGGVRHHREVIAASVSRGAFEVEPSQLFLCNGAQHGIDIALRLVSKPGEAVLAEALTYSGFKAIAAANRQSLVPVAMDDEGLIPEALDAACKMSGARVLYTMPTLQSPTARTMSKRRREAIAELANTHDLWIIEDDVYGFFDPERPITVSEIVPSRSFYITSYSKCIAPGFRLGTLTVPHAFAEQASLLIHGSAWFTSPLFTETVVRLIQSGHLELVYSERRRQAAERQRVFMEIFDVAGMPTYPPFFAWLPLPADWSSAEFENAARRAGILVTPATASTIDDSNPTGVRICLGSSPDLDSLADALRRLRQLLEGQPSNIFSVA